jgi:hypothetical protein
MKSLVVNLILFVSGLWILNIVVLFTLLDSSSSNGEPSSVYCPDDSPNYACHPPPTWDIYKNEQPCNIEILSATDYAERFPNGQIPVFHPEPLILRDKQRNALFQQKSQKQEVAKLFPAETVQLPNANLFSFANHNVSIEDYIKLPETFSWDDADKKLYMLTSSIRPQVFDDFYQKPPTLASISGSRLGIGAFGSGAQWHSHGPGFCEALWGRKHWALSMDRIYFDRKRPSRHWFEYEYLSYTTSTNTNTGISKLWECTIHPGDGIYFPNRIWHTTVNLDPYTAFVSQFYDINGLEQPPR